AAARSVAEAFGREAQDLLLNALFDFALEALADIFRGVQLVEAWIALDEQARDAVKSELEELAAALDELDQLHRSDVEPWFNIVLKCVSALGSLIDSGLVPWRSDQFFRDAMAYLFSAAALVQRVNEWFASPVSERGSLFGSKAVTVPNDSSIAAHIASRIKKRPGSALTMGDLAQFVTGADP